MHINMEERGLVVDYIYLGYLLQMVEQDRKRVENDRQPLRKLFLMANDALIDKLHKDLLQVKKTMKERDIKVDEGENNDFTLQFKIWARGYESPFAITREYAKAELSVRLGKYVAELGNAMREK